MSTAICVPFDPILGVIKQILWCAPLNSDPSPSVNTATQIWTTSCRSFVLLRACCSYGPWAQVPHTKPQTVGGGLWTVPPSSPWCRVHCLSLPSEGDFAQQVHGARTWSKMMCWWHMPDWLILRSPTRATRSVPHADFVFLRWVNSFLNRAVGRFPFSTVQPVSFQPHPNAN